MSCTETQAIKNKSMSTTTLIKFSGRQWVLLPFLYMLFTSTGYTEFQITHCNDCGNVLVGAAYLQPDTIQWVNPVSAPANVVALIGSGEVFGFSGPSAYLSEYPSGFPVNIWNLTFFGDFQVVPGPSSTVKIGHVFAPTHAGTFSLSNQYTAMIASQSQPVRRNPAMQGTGVADNIADPAITLDIELQGAELQSCADEPVQCQEATIPDGSELIFTVIPRVDTNKVPQGVKPVNHVWVDFIYSEKDTQCPTQSFQTTNLTQNSFSFNEGSYYHYLYKGGPTFTSGSGTCLYGVSVLVSVDKEFKFQTKNLLSTAGGHVKFVFALRGHYDPDELGNWQGSQPAFRLRTPTSGTLNVTVNGNGTITSDPAGIECTSGTCTAVFQAGTSVELSAPPDIIGVDWSDNCQNGNVGNISVGADINCTVTFPLESNALILSSDSIDDFPDTKFYGTISVNGEGQVLNPNSPVSVGLNTPIEINTSVRVAEVDRDQKAEMVVVMVIENELYMMKTVSPKEDVEFKLWEQGPLIAAGYQEPLGEILEIKVFGGQINNAIKNAFDVNLQDVPLDVQVDVLVGYRIIGLGNIVFNKIPISFRVIN